MSLFDKLTKFRDVACELVDGTNINDADEQSRRRSICGGCEFFSTTLRGPRCASCGCPLVPKWKSKSGTCPKDKFDEEVAETESPQPS